LPLLCSPPDGCLPLNIMFVWDGLWLSLQPQVSPLVGNCCALQQAPCVCAFCIAGCTACNVSSCACSLAVDMHCIQKCLKLWDRSSRLPFLMTLSHQHACTALLDQKGFDFSPTLSCAASAVVAGVTNHGDQKCVDPVIQSNIQCFGLYYLLDFCICYGGAHQLLASMPAHLLQR